MLGFTLVLFEVIHATTFFFIFDEHEQTIALFEVDLFLLPSCFHLI